MKMISLQEIKIYNGISHPVLMGAFRQLMAEEFNKANEKDEETDKKEMKPNDLRKILNHSAKDVCILFNELPACIKKNFKVDCKLETRANFQKEITFYINEEFYKKLAYYSKVIAYRISKRNIFKFQEIQKSLLVKKDVAYIKDGIIVNTKSFSTAVNSEREGIRLIDNEKDDLVEMYYGIIFEDDEEKTLLEKRNKLTKEGYLFNHKDRFTLVTDKISIDMSIKTIFIKK